MPLPGSGAGEPCQSATPASAWQQGSRSLGNWCVVTDAAAKPDDLDAFCLSIDTACLFSLEGGPPSAFAAHMQFTDNSTHFSGDILDAIGRLWYPGKGWRDPEQMMLPQAHFNLNRWPQGLMLCWSERCIRRQDRYLLDDRLDQAFEHSCSNPAFTCGGSLVGMRNHAPGSALAN